MKRTIILFCLCMLAFASCHKNEAPSEIPEKYLQFFPYNNKTLLFKRPNDTIEIKVSISKSIEKDCHGSGWSVDISGEYIWEIETEYGEKKIVYAKLRFDYSKNKDVGTFRFMDYWGGKDILLQDTIILLHNNDINDGYVKFVKNKGLVEINYYYPDDTWTLIE